MSSLVMDTSVDALLVAYHRDGDEKAREQALVELMPLVRALASRYAGRGEPLEDLVQVGSIGLIKAVDRFDVDRGVDFASYAVPTIVGRDSPALPGQRGPCTCRAG
jgi:RNA polymerase sigma-B factor